MRLRGDGCAPQDDNKGFRIGSYHALRNTQYALKNLPPMTAKTTFILTVLFVAITLPTLAQEGLGDRVNARAAEVEDQVIAWRRDIHANPELGNREFRTAALVAEHLTGLGMEVRTEVAHTGVVGLLRALTRSSSKPSDRGSSLRSE